MNKFVFIGIFFVFLLVTGTVGFMVFENLDLWKGLYLTAMTITTVGYGDIVPLSEKGRFFTVLLTFSGVGFVMYSFVKINETMIEGGLRDIFERRKMDKKVAGLKGHYIVCGYGRIGMEICAILHENKRSFVVIENNEEVLRQVERQGYTFLEGEAADDEVLVRAQIDKARGLIAVVSTDADNMFITLTARGLNPKLYILARSSGASGVDTKLMRAGATKVISPYTIGARRMAQLIVRPTVIDFIDLTMHAGDLGLRMEEILVLDQAAIADKTLLESGIRKKYDIIVVAIKRQNQEMIFNPGPDSRILSGDILIVLGEHDSIIRLEKEV